jgi:hypothetical protein
VTWDFAAPEQLEDWVPAARPGWLTEALEGLALTPAPSPYDKLKPWSHAKGSLFVHGFERRVTRALFAPEPLRIEVQARLLAGRNLVVTLGDPARPFVVAVGLVPPDATFAAKPGRTKEQTDELARLAKKWKATFPKASGVVARELAPLDWEPTAPVDVFSPPPKPLGLTIDARRDETGDSLKVTYGSWTRTVSLGTNALTVGPVGIESFGRPLVLEGVKIEGVLSGK